MSADNIKNLLFPPTVELPRTRELSELIRIFSVTPLPPEAELLNIKLADTLVASAFAVKTKSLPTFAKVAFCKPASALDITPCTSSL